jgi:antitoxin PrlF
MDNSMVKDIERSVADQRTGCCSVVAMVSVDERGQMVLPKDLRNRLGIKPGDKLAVVAFEKDSELCCISLVRTEVLSDMVKDVLKPVMREVF